MEKGSSHVGWVDGHVVRPLIVLHDGAGDGAIEVLPARGVDVHSISWPSKQHGGAHHDHSSLQGSLCFRGLLQRHQQPWMAEDGEKTGLGGGASLGRSCAKGTQVAPGQLGDHVSQSTASNQHVTRQGGIPA